jgi:hypothetical protein
MMERQGIIPNLGRDIVYDYQVVFDGGYNATCMYAVAEMYNWDMLKKVHSVRRPSADSLPWATCVILPGAEIETNSGASVAAATFLFDNRPTIASLTDSSAAATIGCSLGTSKDEFGLKVGNMGFTCTGVIVDEGAGGRRLVYVRPGGGGASPFDPKFIQWVGAASSYNFLPYAFIGGTLPAPVYNSAGVFAGEYISNANYPAATDAPISLGASIADRWAYKYGVGVGYGVRIGSGSIRPRSVGFVWYGTDPRTARFTALPPEYESAASYPINYFILADGFPRAVGSVGYTGATAWNALEFSYHGGSVTGALLAKASTVQPIGSGTLQVTTAAGSGALDLKVRNELIVTVGGSTQNYRVAVAIAEPSPNTDVTISITPSLTTALAGGETVALVASWNVEWTTLVNSLTPSTFPQGAANFRGFPGSKFVVNLRPAVHPSTNIVTNQVAQTRIYYDGSNYSLLDNLTYTNGVSPTYNYDGCYGLCDIAATADGTIWGLGAVNRSYGSPEYGFFRYDGGAWTRFPYPTIPGFTVGASGLSSGEGYFTYLPDGRLVACVKAYKAGDSSYFYSFLYLLDGADAPEQIAFEDWPIILSVKGDSNGADNLMIGNSASGVEVYFANNNRRLAAQYMPFSPGDIRYLPLPLQSFWSLFGSTSTGTIVGALTAKASTVQPIGSTSVIVTTAPGTGSIDLKQGNRLKIGSGPSAAYYFVQTDTAEPNPNTDVSIPLTTPLTVALSGGEVVVLRDGWASMLTPTLDAQGNPLYYYSGIGSVGLKNLR